MSDLTLPGTIPGLLRRGSPVIVVNAAIGVVDEVTEVGVFATDGGALHAYYLDQVALDLTDPTGRIHAAWWVMGHDDRKPGIDAGSWVALRGLALKACPGEEFSDYSLARFRHLCLMLAGLEVSP